jgi:hypothetical protein
MLLAENSKAKNKMNLEGKISPKNEEKELEAP